MQRRIGPSDRILLSVLVVHLVLAMAFGAAFLQGLKDDRAATITDTPVAAEGGGSTTGTTGTTDTTTTGGADDDGTSGDAIGGTTGSTAGTTGANTSGTTSGGTDGSTTGATTDGTATTGTAGATTGDDEPLPEGPIKIGTLVTQTGAINFRAAAQATKAYIDLINEQGGVHGRQIELILRDDGLDPARGRRAIEEMLNQGVFAFVGFVAPLTEPSINPTLEQNQIPLIGAFGITASDWGYMFNGYYESFGWTSARFLADQGVTNPGLIYISRQDAETDRRIDESWRQAFESKGVTLSDNNIHRVDVAKANYDDVVTSLRLSGVDGIVTSIDQTAIIRLQQSLNRANYRPIHAASQLADDPKVLNDPDIKASLEGTYVYSEFHFLGEQTGEVPRYEAEVRRRFGADAELNWAGKNNWASTKLFVDALVAAGPDPTRGHLMAALNAFTNHETGMTVPLTIGSDPVSHIRNNNCVKIGKIVQSQVEPISGFDCYEGPLL
jgi:branched-chain amino acid transport system substrate-binding protein